MKINANELPTYRLDGDDFVAVSRDVGDHEGCFLVFIDDKKGYVGNAWVLVEGSLEPSLGGI